MYSKLLFLAAADLSFFLTLKNITDCLLLSLSHYCTCELKKAEGYKSNKFPRETNLYKRAISFEILMFQGHILNLLNLSENHFNICLTIAFVEKAQFFPPKPNEH